MHMYILKESWIQITLITEWNKITPFFLITKFGSKYLHASISVRPGWDKNLGNMFS
jgi:hypothetical protein